MNLIELARKLRPLIEYAAEGLADKEASEGVQLFPKLKQDGSLVKANTRINWNGTLKRASVDLWDTEQNNPDNAPTLWHDIAYRDGYRIAPETFTAVNAAAKDECMWFGNTLWKSTMNGNVYTPVQAPNAWVLMEVDE